MICDDSADDGENAKLWQTAVKNTLLTGLSAVGVTNPEIVWPQF